MAIDTENKRRSVVYILPEPDGTIAAVDRQQTGWIYSGIAAGAVAEVVSLFQYVAKSRTFRYIADSAIFRYKTKLKQFYYEIGD